MEDHFTPLTALCQWDFFISEGIFSPIKNPRAFARGFYRMKLSEVGLCVVAIDSGGSTEGLAVGSDGLAVVAKAVRDHAGGIAHTVAGVEACHIDGLVDGLGTAKSCRIRFSRGVRVNLPVGIKRYSHSPVKLTVSSCTFSLFIAQEV